jgi:ATP-dependent Clp protease ATP-binding subunit ClpX
MTVEVQERSSVLDLYLASGSVVGQEKARKQMAVLLHRQAQVAEGLLPYSNGAVIGGRSGTGKTMMARLMCRHSGLPFAETNATRYTEAGYAGLDLNKMFLPLLEATASMKDALTGEPPPTVPSVLHRPDIQQIVEAAQVGVVLLDEFDKWMLRVNHVTGKKDNAIQADLLKMIEGSCEYISDNEDEVGILFDTSRVLILCAGAFVNLQGIVARRLDKQMDDVTIWDQITQEDFVKYGVLPELAGRLSTHIFLKPLQVHHLQEILLAPGGLADEYRQRFEAVGCQWAVPPEGFQQIAATAIQRETGARAVEHICWQVFAEALFEASVSERAVKVIYLPMKAKAWLEAV